MPVDPRELGALCDECWLRDHSAGGPVPAEMNPGARCLIIGEAPGLNEVRLSRPFIGESGDELERGLRSLGMHRQQFSITNALLCRPSDNEFERMSAEWKKLNLQLKLKGEELRPHPVKCCKPRLAHEMRQFRNIILMGKQAYHAVTGHVGAILTLRGQPMEGWLDETYRFIPVQDEEEQVEAQEQTLHRTYHRILPTLHPAFVLRQRRWTAAFRADLARAQRWFQDRMNWKEPEMVFVPTPAVVEEFIRQAPYFAYDTETDDLEPLIAHLRCVVLAREDKALVIPFLGVDGESRFYGHADAHRIASILARAFTDPGVMKIGHNAKSYDIHVVRRHLGVAPAPVIDTLNLAHATAPELPHDLGFVGQTYCDIHNWKASHTAVTAKTDRELWKYAAYDGVVNAIVATPLSQAVTLRNQQEVVRVRHKIMDFCADMHRIGMKIDRELVKKLDIKYRTDALIHLHRMRMACGKLDLNPNSVRQMRQVLFERWQLPMVKFSEKTGDPSVDDEVIRHYLRDRSLGEAQKTFFDSTRRFRRAAKFRGTYLLKLKPREELVCGDDLSYDADNEGADEYEPVLDRTAKSKRGYLLADGRLHPFYNPCGTKGWRLSSSEPNCQNWPATLRAVVIPEPGHTFVQVDMDQIEFRMVSALSNSPRYLEAFEKGADAHAVTAEFLFGEKFTKLAKDDPLRKQLRQTGKVVRFAIQYGSAWLTVYEVVVSTEDPTTGDLPYADFAQDEVHRLYDRLLERDPYLPRWWDSELQLFRQNNCLFDPVLGMRLDFLDGEERNKVLSFRSQSGSAAIVHLGTMQLMPKYHYEFAGPNTGFLNQTHDSLLLECPTELAEQAASDMKEAMTRTIPGLPVRFTASVKIGKVKTDDSGTVLDPQIRWSRV